MGKQHRGLLDMALTHSDLIATCIFWRLFLQYDRSKLAKPSNIDFRKVGRINFAFFQCNEMGFIWGTDAWADSNLLVSAETHEYIESSLNAATDYSRRSVQFGPQNWNPGPNDPTYCSWDGPSWKSCKSHMYEEGKFHRSV